MMRRIFRLRGLLRRPENGQSLAEFALIAPIFFLLVFGIVDLSRAFQAYTTIQEAARSGARYAVTGRIDCTGVAIQSRDACIKQAVAVRVTGLSGSGSVTTSYRSWAYPTYASPPTEGNAGQQCDAVEVEVHYTYKPMTPIFNKLVGSIPMGARERMVNEPFGTCS
jgi:Flp pilus assembly protein TadG